MDSYIIKVLYKKLTFESLPQGIKSPGIIRGVNGFYLVLYPIALRTLISFIT